MADPKIDASRSGAIFAARTTLFLVVWRGPGPSEPLHSSTSGGGFAAKNTLFLEFWRGSGGGGRVKVDVPPVHIWCFFKHVFLLVFLSLFDDREDERDESGYFSKTDPPFFGGRTMISSF